MANAVFLGIQTDVDVRSNSQDDDLWIKMISALFSVLFAVELFCKLAAYKLKFFFCKQGFTTCLWNYLDFLIVTTSIAELGFDAALALGDDSSTGQSTNQFRILRIIRVSRLIRVIRITRIIQFIRALRTMVHQLVSTMKALLWALVLLLLLIYVFAILFTQAVAMRLDGLLGGIDEEMTYDEGLRVYWSTLPRSMMTLFQAITSGVSWDEASRPLSDLGCLPVGLFCVYVCFTQLAVLNVVTGVFCQNAIESAANDQELAAQAMLEHRQILADMLRIIFQSFDADNNGEVTIQEFREHLNDDHLRAYLDSLGLDTSDVMMLFRLLDTDGGSALQLDEFVSGCMRLKGTAKGIDMAKLIYTQDVLAKRMDQFVSKAMQAFEILLEVAPRGGRERRPRLRTRSLAPRRAKDGEMIRAGMEHRVLV
mmetsp:Transcript_75283/g.243731  ORF Transcript_75283/g.243731 Transcript_75283/m.243731 type:complete len:424 (-) Transcript_75283:108-1379(-)